MNIVCTYNTDTVRELENYLLDIWNTVRLRSPTLYNELTDLKMTPQVNPRREGKIPSGSKSDIKQIFNEPSSNSFKSKSKDRDTTTHTHTNTKKKSVSSIDHLLPSTGKKNSTVKQQVQYNSKKIEQSSSYKIDTHNNNNKGGVKINEQVSIANDGSPVKNKQASASSKKPTKSIMKAK